MDVIYPRVAGLDVHKKMVMACVMVEEAGKVKQEVRQFPTVMEELQSLKAWLKSHGVTHVAMESTGVYWKPVFHVLGEEFNLLLGNAQHIKNVPGRKTDVKDCEWIASLMRCGLIRGSFIPCEALRDLRDLTRYRVKLVQALNSEKNRVQRVLEDTNVKLASVISDVFGKTGRLLLEALLKGEDLDEEDIEGLMQCNLKASVEEIGKALKGRLRDHHRFMIQSHLDHITHLSQAVAAMDRRIEARMAPYAREWELLTTIPGIDKTSAAVIVAEIGTDMSQFSTPAHLASWARVCPGNNESAGKKKALGSILERTS